MKRENKKHGKKRAQTDAHKTDARSTDAKNSAAGSGHSAEYSCDNDELIAKALQSVYRQTVDEELPSEFQDLLDKLN